MANAYGFIEISGVTAALSALDVMCKTADIHLASWERKWGGRLVTIIIQGDVSAVKEAVEVIKNNGGIKTPAACGILANPHPEIIRLIDQSANEKNTHPRHSGLDPESPESDETTTDCGSSPQDE